MFEDGFDWDYTGLVHRFYPLTKMIHLELEKENGHIMKIDFDDIVGEEIVDKRNIIMVKL